MTFMDTTFCMSAGCLNKCNRQMTEDLYKKGVKWGGEGFLYAAAYFCDEQGELLSYEKS